MARPNKQGIDYFPLDINIDQDDKLQMVIAEYGHKGELYFIKLLGWIYGGKGYYTEWNEMEQLKFVKRVSYIGDSPMNLINNIISKCIKWEIFNKDLYDQYKILTSVRIQQTWLDASRKRKDRFVSTHFWLLPELTGLMTEETPKKTEETTQSKVKKSKLNEKKEEGAEPFFVRTNFEVQGRAPNAPSLDAVKEFFWQQGKQDDKDAENFFNYYEALGWRQGITPIFAWRAMASKWIANPLPQKNNNYGNSQTFGKRQGTPATGIIPDDKKFSGF